MVSSGQGRTGRPWRRAQALCMAEGAANGTPCWMCGRPIDYEFTKQYPLHRMAGTVHHIVGLAQNGDPLDPTISHQCIADAIPLKAIDCALARTKRIRIAYHNPRPDNGSDEFDFRFFTDSESVYIQVASPSLSNSKTSKLRFGPLRAARLPPV